MEDKRAKILIVDDVMINRKILSEVFAKEYNILEACDGKEAIDLIKANKYELAIVLLDIKMPVMDGFEVLKVMKKLKLMDAIPVILITGDTSVEVELKGYDMGVADLITKPFDPHVIKKRVKNTIELYYHKNNLEKLVDQQTKKIERQAEKLRKQKKQIIDTLSAVVEFRNLESCDHVIRVQGFTKILLEAVSKMYPEYKLTSKRIESITLASALHDIGKIAVPDNILLKPGKLTVDEFDIIKTHTTKGSAVIDNIAFVDDKTFHKDCYNICRYHHEKYDGKGYPEGLEGDNIPFSAQVVSLADVYDTLISDRVYKAAYSLEEAFDMIVCGECGVFNPKLIECFIKVKPKLEKFAKKYI